MEYFMILLITAVKAVPILWLTLYAFHNQLRLSPAKNVTFTILFTLVLSTCSYCLIRNNQLDGIYEVFFATTVLIIAVFIFSLFLNHFYRDILKIVFTLFMAKSITDCIVLTARLFHETYVTGGIFDKLIQDHFITRLGLTAILFDCTLMLISVPLVFFIIRCYVHPIINVAGNMPFWNYLWVIPTSFFVIFRYLVYPGYYDNSFLPPNYILVLSPIWIVFMLMVYLVMLKMLLQTSNNLQLQKELELSNMHMNMQIAHYDTLQKGIEEMRMAKHDTRHQIAMLQGYVKNQDLASIEKALNMNMEYLDSNSYKPYCQNYALDSIIWSFTKLIEENNILLHVKVDIPKDAFVTMLDLSILFGNLIENGIEACCRQNKDHKFLMIKARMINEKIMIISVKNSYEGTIAKNSNTFMSSKREGEGIGIKSVYSIAKKYHGLVQIRYDESVFKVQVLLNSLQP